MTKLFVGNLPYKATEADIQAFFEEAGVHVDSVNILRDRFSGEARGFGFVEINDDSLANQAIQACTEIIFGLFGPIQPNSSISAKAFHIPISPTPPPQG